MSPRDVKPPDGAGQRLAASLLSVLGSKGQEPPRVDPIPPPKPRVVEVTPQPERGYVMQPGEDEEPPQWDPHNVEPKRTRRHYSDQVKADAVALVLQIGRGGVAEAARRYQASQSIVSKWVSSAEEQRAKQQPKPPEPKKSEPVKLTITIEGLDEYIDQRVDARLLRRLTKILGDED